MNVTREYAPEAPLPGDVERGLSPALTFVLALTVAVPLEPLARLTLFDLVASYLAIQAWRTAAKQFSGLLVLLVVSLAAMAASSYVNGSGVVALTGRAYQMLALFVEAVGYFVLANRTNERGREALVLGAMLGVCCHYFYPNDLRVLDNPIKFLVGVPLGVAVMASAAIVSLRGSVPPILASALMVFYALFCFLIGSRSIGGVFFASGAIVALIGFISVPKNYAKIAPFLAILFGLSLYGFTELYAYLAIRGFFGSTAQGIAIFQDSFGSILIGGRPEILVNLSGIVDAPLFGVGINNYPSLYLYEMVRLSVYSQDDVLGIDNILYHSAIFATAFETGILSALFWVSCMYQAIFSMPLLRAMPTGRRAYILPLLLITAWHSLYSPPIPYNRFVMGLGLALALLVRADWRRQLLAKPEVKKGENNGAT